ncbi:MAG: hypothetical protein A3I12_01135 [Gammaproteobacteria bacterium RIFCSPLOWO2_02_FULL_38_11]|nr:MAG: hypothetical protein A3I12_01135 [Gammaproteobacteria bacterium RIFCSPLOWO2_02_FULL_38_11]OGT76409.1 MAG: hypothetical protein A3G71_03930 [Gammaproteobacteria bacterium RIFCSPLOWO2_12_FULL_38_14]
MPNNENDENIENIENKFLNLDPLVGDALCQTRVPYFIYLLRKLRENKPLLTEEEKKEKEKEDEYIKNCDILTQTRNVSRDNFGLIVDEVTDIQRFPNANKELPSKTKLNKLVIHSKSLVANQTIDFLKRECSGLTRKDEIEREFEKQNLIKRFEDIPILSFYLSTKLMLHYAAREKIPLVINLKRLLREKNREEKEEYSLLGAVSLCYQSCKKKFVLSKLNTLENDLVIAFDMYSCLPEEQAETISSPFGMRNFDTFIRNFKSLEIDEVILMCACIHSQFPKTARVEEEINNLFLHVAHVCDEEETNISSLDIASIKDYQYLKNLAKKFRLPEGDSRYAKLTTEKTKIERTKEFIPFQVDHVYLSTTQACHAKTQQLLKDNEEKRIHIPVTEEFSQEK